MFLSLALGILLLRHVTEKASSKLGVKKGLYFELEEGSNGPQKRAESNITTIYIIRVPSKFVVDAPFTTFFLVICKCYVIIRMSI